MKLAFYVDSSGGTPQNLEIYNFLNREIENGNLTDAAVFFNSVNFNPVRPHFGMFDATELWHFTGNLITTSVLNTVKARKVVNRFKVAYLFNKDDKNEQTVFELANIARGMKILVTNEEDAALVYRLTGTNPHLLDELSAEKISEVFDERV